MASSESDKQILEKKIELVYEENKRLESQTASSERDKQILEKKIELVYQDIILLMEKYKALSDSNLLIAEMEKEVFELMKNTKG